MSDDTESDSETSTEESESTDSESSELPKFRGHLIVNHDPSPNEDSKEADDNDESE